MRKREDPEPAGCQSRPCFSFHVCRSGRAGSARLLVVVLVVVVEAERCHLCRVAQRGRGVLACRPLVCCFVPSVHPQGIISQWRSPWLDAALPSPPHARAAKPWKGSSSVSRQSAGAAAHASRTSHHTSRHESVLDCETTAKSVGPTYLRISTPAGRDIRDYWHWRQETPTMAQPTGGDAHVLWRSDGRVAIAPCKSYLPTCWLRLESRGLEYNN